MRISLLVIVMVTGAAASAQPAGSPPAPRTMGEQVFIAPSGEPFRAPVGAAYPSAAWIASADTNHDGRMSLSEFTASFARFFATLDADHDGALRSEEIQHYEQDVTPEVRSYGFGNGRSGRRGGFANDGDFAQLNSQGDNDSSPDVGKSTEIEGDLKNGPMGAGRYALINIPEPVAAMDTDFNGIVTKAEMQSAARRRFALLDPQGKGSLSLAELPETWAQAHPRRLNDRSEGERPGGRRGGERR